MVLEAFLVTALVTALLILAFNPVALALGFVDRPGGRKRHRGEVPITGGFAMFAGFCVGLTFVPDSAGGIAPYVAACGLLVIIGLVDDRFHLPATVKLIAQVAAVLTVGLGGGLIMRDIGDPLWLGRLELGPLSLVISALIYITVINAYNLIDGLDGLAGSMAFIALMAVLFVAAPGSLSAMLAAIVAGAVAGYLAFNLPLTERRPFRTFMGDAGSTFLGLSIVIVTVMVCQGPDRVISPVHGLWFAALPVYDLLTCFVRRVIRGRSPFEPGRDHFHHRLRAAGMSARKSAATLVLLQAAYAAIGLAGVESGISEPIVFTAWAVLGVAQLPLVVAIGRLYSQLRRRNPA